MKQPDLTHDAVDRYLQEWAQGDCVVESQVFVFGYEPDFPTTDASKSIDPDPEIPFGEEDVLGLVVVSQTCDIIKGSTLRPYVEVSPIIGVSPELLKEIQGKRRPQFAEIPALTSKGLVADLDRVMTVEKPVLLKWKRIPGCSTDEQRRAFSKALARKRSRPALRDDFVTFLNPLQKRWIEKHDKNSNEGKILRCFSEVRIQASPDWDSASIKVRFWFLLRPGFCDSADINQESMERQINTWLSLLKTEGTRFAVDHFVGPYGEMSARDYVTSDQLDYDYLSD